MLPPAPNPWACTAFVFMSFVILGMEPRTSSFLGKGKHTALQLSVFLPEPSEKLALQVGTPPMPSWFYLGLVWVELGYFWLD